MIGKGYCELSIAKFNLRIYSFQGINFKDKWIDNNFICMGDYIVNSEDIWVEFCKI